MYKRVGGRDGFAPSLPIGARRGVALETLWTYLLQATIEGELDKRGGKNFGPPSGCGMTVFLDDVSMPEVGKSAHSVSPGTLYGTYFFTVMKPLHVL